MPEVKWGQCRMDLDYTDKESTVSNMVEGYHKAAWLDSPIHAIYVHYKRMQSTKMQYVSHTQMLLLSL